MTDTDLPIIHSLSVSRTGGSALERDGKKIVEKQASAFLSRLQLGHLQPLPKPGDVFRSPISPRQPRPLGLIPGHSDRLDALKKLNQLLSPWSVNQPRHVAPLFAQGEGEASLLPPDLPLVHTQEAPEVAAGCISATVCPVQAATDPNLPTLHPMAAQSALKTSTESTAYRLTRKGLSHAAPTSTNLDPDYMGDKASQYYALLGERPQPTLKPALQVRGPSNPPPFPHSLPPNTQGQQKKAKLKG